VTSGAEDAADICTIIVSWNTRDLLVRCLRELTDNTQRRQSIWVVDNASTDGSAEAVRQLFPDVQLIASEQNLGFAAANNLALRTAAPAGYALLLNPDTEARPHAVDNLAAYLDGHSDVGAVGLQLLNPDGTLQRSFDYFYSFAASFWRNLAVDRLVRRTRGTVTRSPGEAMEVDWIVGACVMLRARALKDVGLLDERFFMYGEEIDLQWRLRRAGWRVMLLPGVHVVHYGGQSSKQTPSRMMVQEYKSRYLLIRENTPRSTLVLYVAKAIVALAVWTAFWGASWMIKRNEGARDSFRAYKAVLKQHLRPGFYAEHA
jgi:GT2 family glycosyltransferase